MSEELFSRLRAYSKAISLLRQVADAGLHSNKEFQTAEAALAKKYTSSERSIRRFFSLQCSK